MMSGITMGAIIISGAVLAACGSAPRAGGGADCLLADDDSTFLAGGPVFRECAVDEPARERRRIPPTGFRPQTPPAGGGMKCYLVELEFVVDTNGMPETKTARVRRSTDTNYTDAVLTTLAQWRYSPAKKDGMPVRQIVRETSAAAVGVTVVRAGDPTPPRTTPTCPTRAP
jgi:hypothetical protein